MSLINKDYCEKLVAEWYDYAKNNVTEINDKLELYEKTEEVASTIKKDLGDAEKAVQAKSLAKVILKTFDKYDEDQSKKLSIWIGVNTFKKGNDIKGANPAFHLLVEALLAATESSKADKLIYSRSLFNFIDSYFEKLIPEKIDLDAMGYMRKEISIHPCKYESQNIPDYLLL